MLKYSLGSLLIVMAVVALGCAALANWSPIWAEIMTTVTVALLLLGVLVAFAGRGSMRTFATGFAAVGVAYFLLAFCAPAELRDQRLATRRAVDRLFALTQKTKIDADATLSEVVFVDYDSDSRADIYLDSNGGGTGRSLLGVGSGGAALVRGAVVLTTAPQEFRDIGHCLWTLFLALIGGVLAQVIQRTSRREETPGPRS